MKDVKFYICETCGKVIQIVEDRRVPTVCCGKPMKLLEAGTVDASREKHIPEVEIDGDLLHVTVGAVLHPMTEPHHIAWIYVQFENGGQLVYLDHEGEPKATVALGGKKPVAVYEYCNLHGLWKKEL